MGGTRCVFRDCQVSTQRNPKMHFFKLPVRDPVRLAAWLKNCGNADILNVAREKLSNRAVCARHFRYECFMNYKLDRLIPNQTPTLARVSKELAWDLEHLDENGEATVVKLSTPTLAYLIPPNDFECPLGFTDDARFGRKYTARRRTPPRPLAMEPNKKQKLAYEPLAKGDASPAEDLTTEVNATASKLPTEPKKNVINLEKSIESKSSVDISVLQTPPPEKIDKDIHLKYDQLLARHNQLLTENASLKQTVVKLETEAKALTTSTPSTSTSSAPQMTKPQLYNGIKKYLGPTMAALVRMEMFGSAERAWKDDEQDFAKELLQLGEDVYTHCCDEWRFRLPSLRMTRCWLDNSAGQNAEDEGL